MSAAAGVLLRRCEAVSRGFIWLSHWRCDEPGCDRRATHILATDDVDHYLCTPHAETRRPR